MSLFDFVRFKVSVQAVSVPLRSDVYLLDV